MRPGALKGSGFSGEARRTENAKEGEALEPGLDAVREPLPSLKSAKEKVTLELFRGAQV